MDGGRVVDDCHDPGGHCGMVSLVFGRTTLRKFLDWASEDDRWKEKPIDWTLNDFVKLKNLDTICPYTGLCDILVKFVVY